MSAQGTPRVLRLVPVPRPAPPVPPPPVAPTPAPHRYLAAPVQGTLALELVPAAPPAPLVDLRSWDEDEPAHPCDPAGLPDPRRWSALIAQAVVEILAGRRPVAQVLRWLEPTLYERVRASAATSATRTGRRRPGVPVRVRRVRVSTGLEGSVESVAVVDDGVRCRALALRLEAVEGRWLCTSLDVV